MSNQTISVAYCSDNEAAVKSLIEPLQNSNNSFQFFAGNRSTDNESLAEQLLRINQPILLFISDNFLKSAQCMSRALKLLHEKRQHILPIVIDGVAKDDNTGETISIQTDFDRVSDIIQYINYWQDQYLDLRRQRRQIEGLNEEKFSAHLKVMREISSEAGEFLRLLRSMIYLNALEFQANHYEQFFLLIDDNEAWRQFKTANPDLRPSLSVENERTEPEMETETEAESEDTAPPVDISAIPGADMLGLGEEAPSSSVEESGNSSDTAESDTTTDNEEEINDDNEAGEQDLEEAENIEVTPDEEIVIDDVGPLHEDDREAASIIDAAVDTPMVEETPVAEKTGVINEEEEVDKSGINQEIEENRLIQEAANYFNHGQQKEGLDHLAKAVKEYPDSASLKYHYALFIAQKSEDYASAITVLEPVIDIEPNNENALFLLGELHELEGDFKEARALYETLIEINDQYPHVNYRLGMIIASHYENESELAGAYFKEAIKQDASNTDAMYQYALLLSAPLNKPKKGVKLLKKIIKEDPDHPFATYDLALIYHALGKQKKAHKAYTDAIAINPELQTAENDRAFAQFPTDDPIEDQPEMVSSDISFEALEALKNNIGQLEEMLQYSESERAKLKLALEEAETNEAVTEPPKVDQTVLITGATSGIGKATADRFARAGYRVIITGRREDRLASVQEYLTSEYQAEVHTLAFDVRDKEAVDQAIHSLEGQWAEIDILINNAGKAKGLAPIHEGEIAHWEEMIDTNFRGLLYLSRVVSPLMVKRQKGHIINVCSTAGKEVYPNGNVYCATKFAVDALTKSMRMDLFKHQVRVSMVSPAHVDETEFALVRFDGDATRAKIYDDFKPLSSPDVADTIFFIANQPGHVNILDVVMQGTQQAHSMLIDRSGRELYEEE
jgi:NADP-dependent 3-hydroxy acid dehydrogenase YdfG/tetratricopeptide (TPR) repeat protein